MNIKQNITILIFGIIFMFIIYLGVQNLWTWGY